MKSLAVHSLNISTCKLGAHCKVHELIPFGYRKRFKWTVEHDPYMLREMLASKKYGCQGQEVGSEGKVGRS